MEWLLTYWSAQGLSSLLWPFSFSAILELAGDRRSLSRNRLLADDDAC